ncbi:MAG: ribonuclease Y [Deltaproteobacteria bacterium]
MKLETLLIAIIAVVVGLAGGFLLRKLVAGTRIQADEKFAEKVLNDAKREAETIKKEAMLQAKDYLYQARGDFEKESKDKRLELQGIEKRLVHKEENLDKKQDLVEKRDNEVVKREKSLAQAELQVQEKEKKYTDMIEEERKKLESISGISSEEAKQLLIADMESEARQEAAKIIKKIEEETREVADGKAKEIIATAIQRYAGEYVAERTTSVVHLPSDEMKGRIIGREGRNIRALEAATGVDFIIDDTPEAIIISGHNPVRREVARQSIGRLVADGRIHPARIEEVVAKVTQEIENSIKEAGEQATFDTGLHGIHPELVKLIGKLKYRTSYAQNVYAHSMEVAFICGVMAAELGINQKQAKRAGLLHDIGKAVDHEVEGSHAVIGAELAKKYGEHPRVVHAIMAHHEEEKPSTVLAFIVAAADALSAARPGARREMVETYIKRLEDLERISTSFKGVNKSYAIQAGREIRVLVEPTEINDEASLLLARDIARKIESEMTYPGQIKVTVVRETRAVEVAK